MTVTLYADVLFLVNFSMDFVSLYAAALVDNAIRKKGRMTLGASIGAAYGVIAVIYIPSGILTYLSSAVVSILMCIAAFGFDGGIRQTVRRSAVTFGVGALIGGLMTVILSLAGRTYTYAGENVGSVSAASVFAIVGTLVLVLVFKSATAKEKVYVTLTFRSKSISFSALTDSGNLLRDPISGDPVIIVSALIMSDVLPDETVMALIYCDTDKLTGKRIPFRFIRHKTGTGEAMSCAFLPDKIDISDGKRKYSVRALVLPADVGADYFASLPATVPSALLKRGIADVIADAKSKKYSCDERKTPK